ncbi:MAG: hypothetical protein MSC51_03660 [Mollicutes bacterium]|nr:hypothetical protein [Mollicutes bacterium]
MGKLNINNVVRVPCKLDGKFFKYWFDFLQPLHNLTKREKEVVACYIKKKYELSQSITDETILNKYLMSKDIEQQIKEECNLKTTHLQVVLTKLRKQGIITQDGAINPKYIPKVDPTKNSFSLLIYFDFNE